MVVEKQQERHNNDKKRRFRRPFQRSPTNGSQRNHIKEKDKIHNVTTSLNSSSNFQHNSTNTVVNVCSKDLSEGNTEINNGANNTNNHELRPTNNRQNKNYSNLNNATNKDQQPTNIDNSDKKQSSSGTCVTVDDNEQVKLSTNRNKIEKQNTQHSNSQTHSQSQLNPQTQSQTQTQPTRQSNSKLHLNSQSKQQINPQHNSHIPNKSSNNTHHHNNHHHSHNHYNNHYNTHDRYNHDRRGRGYNYSSNNKQNYHQMSYDNRKTLNNSNNQNSQMKSQNRSQYYQNSSQNNLEKHYVVKESSSNVPSNRINDVSTNFNNDNNSNNMQNNNNANGSVNTNVNVNNKKDFHNTSVRRESNVNPNNAANNNGNFNNNKHVYRDNSTYHLQKDSNKVQNTSQREQNVAQVRINKSQLRHSTSGEFEYRNNENNFESRQRQNNSESNVDYKSKSSKHEGNNINLRSSNQNYYNHGGHPNTTWKGSNNVNHTYSRQNRYSRVSKHPIINSSKLQPNINEVRPTEGTVELNSRSNNTVSTTNLDDLKKKRTRKRYNRNTRAHHHHHHHPPHSHSHHHSHHHPHPHPHPHHHYHQNQNNVSSNLSKDKHKVNNLDGTPADNLPNENDSRKVINKVPQVSGEGGSKDEKVTDSRRRRSHSTGVSGATPVEKSEELASSQDEEEKIGDLGKNKEVLNDSSNNMQDEPASQDMPKETDDLKNREVASKEVSDDVSKEPENKKDSSQITTTVGPWRRPNHGGQAVDSLEAVRRTVKSLLNKITVEKFTVIAEKLAVCIDEIKDVDELEELVKQVLDKAITEPDFSEMYADLCQILKWRSPTLLKKDNKTTIGFSKALLIRCEQEFKNLPRNMTPTDEERELYDSEELSILYRKRKLHVLGIIRLIGELFIRKMFPMRSLNELVFDLVMIQENPDEYAIECLCQLIMTTGYYLDSNEKSQMIVDQWFGRLKELQKSHISTRLNCLIQDVFDLRKHKWVKKVHKQKAKALADILKDIDVEDVLGGAAIAAQYGSVVVVGERSNLVGNSAYYNYMTSQEELYLAKQKSSQK